VPLDRRIEAIAVLRDWGHPQPRDRVLGMWRPFPADRDAAAARASLAAALPRLLAASPATGDERFAAAVLEAAAALGVGGIEPLLVGLCEDLSRDPDTRAAALATFASVRPPEAATLAERLVADGSPVVRLAARRVRAAAIAASADDTATRAEALAAELAGVCVAHADDGQRLREQQGAIDLLAALDTPAAAAAVKRLAERLEAGTLDPRLALEVIEARGAKAGRKPPPSAAADASAATPPAEMLHGGDAARGREIFFRRASVECIRCHRAEHMGGEMGPPLDGIGDRRDRAYLLESVLRPSSRFAEGYRTAVVVTDDGRTLAGIVKAETPTELSIQAADGRIHRIPTAQIEDRADGASAMPADLAARLSRRELRDLVEWLASLRRPP